jgi:phosphohistidine phosphatase
MQVFIMRHGQAEEFTEQSRFDDSQRALTEQGKQEAKIMAAWLENQNLKPSQVLVSPYMRAQQTCDIVTQGWQSNIVTVNFITPAGDAKQVHDYIDGLMSDLEINASIYNASWPS